MAKYKHLTDTRIALDDLQNRLQQLIEVNQSYVGAGHDDKMIADQNQGISVALILVKQVINTGHVKRGTPVIPDDVEPLAITKWNNRPQLGLSEQMLTLKAK